MPEWPEMPPDMLAHQHTCTFLPVMPCHSQLTAPHLPASKAAQFDVDDMDNGTSHSFFVELMQPQLPQAQQVLLELSQCC